MGATGRDGGSSVGGVDDGPRRAINPASGSSDTNGSVDASEEIGL